MTAKHQFFYQVLGGLKGRSAYFSRDSIQAAVEGAGLSLKRPTLSVYLNQAAKQGLIHDAGRGWYSRLAEPVKLDLQACAKLVREVEKAFPLLDFTVWSTAQLNPWMHHLFGKPVHFLHAPRETLETVGEALRDEGWEVAVNPGKRESARVVRPGEKMVVLRPLHSKHLPPSGRQMAVEQVLVELLVETGELALMDESEARAALGQIAISGLIQVPLAQRFAGFKRVVLPDFEKIN
jgi:hypothetical protein